jgi:hypothetical protein
MALTLQEYLDRGGIDSALERHANNVFESFTAEQQQLASSIFSKLITVGEDRLDTRRTATFEELVPAGEDAQAVAAVVGMLSAEGMRLVTTSGVERIDELTAENPPAAQTTVTIAHEKLIDAWPWLRQLIDEKGELIALRNLISDEARKWDEEKDDGYLLRGGRLALVREKLDELKPGLDTLSLKFINASIWRHRLIRLGAALAVTLLLLIFAGATYVFKRQAEENRNIAAEANAESTRAFASEGTAQAEATNAFNSQLVAQAESTKAIENQMAANAESTRAITAEETAEAERAAALLQSQRSQVQSLQANSRALVANEPNNQELAQARLLAVEGAELDSRIGSASEHSSSKSLLFSLAYEQTVPFQVQTTLTDHGSWISSVAWSKDGSRLASASDSFDGVVIIWDTESWQPLENLAEHRNWIYDVAWNKDGSRFASASWDPAIIIYDTVSWQPLASLADERWESKSIAWNEDESLLASTSGVEVIIWDTTSQQPRVILTDHSDRVYDLAWNKDESLLASASCEKRDADIECTQGEIIIWDTAIWQSLAVLSGHAGRVMSVAWNENDSLLAFASWDHTIIIWDTSSWQPQTTPTDHTDQVNSVAWNEDGSRLASASDDGTVIIWEFPDFSQLNCQLAGRNLSLAEWEQYMPGVDYRCTCEEWPAGEGAPPDAPGCAE